MVKIYACNKATKISNKDNTNAKKNDNGLPIGLLNVYIKAIKLINTMCPATIFAYKRIIKENGLIMVPNNSIGAKTNFINTGTPGIQKICPQ